MGGVLTTSLNLFPIYDQILGFSLPHLWPDQKFGTLFMTVAADIVAQNIIFEDHLFMVLLIMMKN